MQKHEIVILIPCFNEEKTIIKICKQAKKFGKILIVNDNSNDNSGIVIEKEKFNFISNKKNLGYERSLVKGFRYIFNNYKKAKYILTLDADGELPVSNIPKIVRIIKKQNYDLVSGKRFRFNRLSEYLLDYIFRSRFDFKDPISGFKLYKIKSLKKIINQISFKMFLVDIVVNFYRLNFLMKNINITTKKRKDNSRVGNRLISNLKILKIVYKILREKINEKN